MSNSEVTTATQEACMSVLGVGADAITPEANLRDDLGADSLDLAELLVEVETRIGVSIPEEEMRNIVTVADAIDAVERHHDTQAAS